MPASHDTDEVDFKPFFDLIVGVLFILLILISAQMFFAQRAAEMSANDQSSQLKLERAKQITLFLESLTGKLRADGITADLGLANRTISIGLDQLLARSDGVAPVFADSMTGALAATLSDPVACVAGGQRTPACAAWPLVRLGEIGLRIDGRTSPPASPLPPDRYLALATNVLSASLLSKAPQLMQLSNPAGAPLMHALAPDAGPAAPQSATARLVFIFEE